MQPFSRSATLVGAVLGAGVHSHATMSETPSPESGRQRDRHRLKALESIRAAQVDLLCNHDHHALQQIHAAQSDLTDAGIDNYTCEALARAAWLAQCRQYAEASEVLESARAGLIYQS